ncbi:hypothetical protein TSUD_133880 [Trifolium subterraneum]|uniref:LOB domain-containing protein n=1 Tax=Trifolium subterraneum TaxID=3900 RepID=A0A2Z6PKM5_TRISU|nr:hypothetical protein TSUD_133880 [Trifolium subterraneum]
MKGMKVYEPRSSSSCAACKLLKRRCIPNCIFAPYFHSNECKKFAKDRLARCRAVAAARTTATTPFVDSLHSHVSLPPFPEFYTSNDLNDIFCHGSSSQLSGQNEIVDDFSQIPYIF